jgi:fructokinase
MSARPVIGVDLGGTKVEVAVVDFSPSGDVTVLARRRTGTRSEGGYEAVLDAVVRFVREVADGSGLDPRDTPVGVGLPGGIDGRGHVKNSNTTCLNGRPFRQDLAARLGGTVVFDNDANCFALAETLLGAARAHRDGLVFGVILGTGVGGGWVCAGRVWDGRLGIAGEWGHHAVVWPSGRSCYCGRTGCVETYLSGPAAEAAYERKTGARRPLAEIASRAGEDEDAWAVLLELADVFGRALANVIDIVDPSAIVLGGGVSNLDLWYGLGRERVAAHVFNDELTTPVLRAELGDSAGVLGAAVLAAGDRRGGG